MNGGRERLLMLGLDAADLDLIRTHAAELPVLGRALSRGRVFEPRSPRGLSGGVWPTFYTGRDPGEHGIYQHLVWDPERMGLRRIGADWCGQEPFWLDLDRRGHRVVAVDVPYSFPAPLERGLGIHDWATHGQTLPLASSGPEAGRWRRRLPRSPIGRETPISKSAAQLRREQRKLLASAALKGELLSSLVREVEWDFFLAVFAETHRGGHMLYGVDGGRPLVEVYRAVDDAIGRVVAACGPTEPTLLLFSPHGMESDFAQHAVVRPLMDAVNGAFVSETLGERAPDRSRGVIRRLRRCVPASIQHAVGAVMPDGVRAWVVEREIIGGLDWRRTPGFPLRADIRSEIRFNVAGREAKGLLPRGEPLHRRYASTVREAFLDLRDVDTGERLVADVLPIPEIHPGPRADLLPDLAVEWRPVAPARRVRSARFGRFDVGGPDSRGGDHRERGFAILVGSERRLPALETTSDFARFVREILGASGR